MSKATSEPWPTRASLRDLPPVKFSRYRVARNPFARTLRRRGIVLAHEGPSAASLRAVPEPDLVSTRARANPYARRLALGGITLQSHRGRPRKGDEVGGTSPRSIRLPSVAWDALEREARRGRVTVHAVIRTAITDYLSRLPPSRAAEPRRRKRAR